MLKPIIKLLTSLRLTVTLLALGVAVVFFGTLAQTSDGLYVAQSRYFRSWFSTWSPHTVPWIVLPLPGGYLLGTLLLVNLISAHLQRFRFAWKKSGIFLTHLGIILLLLGQLFTDMFARESRMSFAEGEGRNYTEDFQKTELAVLTDASDRTYDSVVTIPESLLSARGDTTHPSLPFTIRVREYHENALVRARAPFVDTNRPPASTEGVGTRAMVEGRPPTREMDKRSMPALVAELIGSKGSLGTWLFSMVLDPQEVVVEGKLFRISLRDMRYYQPFSVRLLKTTHETYLGTTRAKNYQSRIRLEHPGGTGDREVDIYMNNPLRYSGLTFFQSQMGNELRDGSGRGTSVFQVVKNPSWIAPYVGCGLVAAGLVVQFMIHLVGFIRKKA